MQIPQCSAWFAYLGTLGHMGQGDKHGSSLILNRSNPAASFSGHLLTLLSATGSLPSLHPSTGVPAPKPLGNCIGRYLEPQKLEIVVC